VVARHAVLTPGQSAPLEVKPGGVHEGIEIELAAGGIVLGEVTDDAGEPVIGIPIELVLDRELSRHMTVTDRDGRFAIGPVRGRGQVTALPPGAPPVEAPISVDAGDEVPVALRIHQASASVRGEIVGSAGEPIVAAVVRVSVAGARAPLARTAISDRFGVFEIPGLPEEPCQLEVEHPDHAPLALEVVPGAPALRLELGEGGSVEGELHDAHSGEPVRGALVSARDSAGRNAGRTRSNISGKFEIRSLSIGNYVIIVEHKGYGPVRLSAPIEDGAERHELGVVELAAAGSVTGQVVDQYGGTVSGADVAPGMPPDWRKAVRTDAQGRFRMTGLAPGEVSFVARAGGSQSEPVEVRIDPGTETEGVALRIEGAIDQPENAAEGEPASEASSTGEPSTEDTEPEAPKAPRLTEGIAARVEYRLGVVRVEEVLGPAARQGGLQVGDALMRIDGEAILAASQARGLMRGRLGSAAAIEVERAGKRLKLKVARERF
jgi:hypothetical protein